MTDMLPLLPPPARVNTTPLEDNHPDDHNAIVDALNELDDRVTDLQAVMGYLRTYTTTTERDADTGSEIDGMLSWCSTDKVLAVWVTDEWVIIMEPWRPWHALSDPALRAWLGTGSELTNITDTGDPLGYISGYRHEFGVCRFFVAARFGTLGGASPTDVLYVEPPLPPVTDSRGPFGSGYCVSLDAIGQVGGQGAFDGLTSPALTGATIDGHLAISMPGTEGLLTAADLAGSGDFDLFWSGVYPTSSLS